MDNLDLEHFKLTWQKKEVIEVPNKVVNDPLVSICVQTFNQVNYIEDCLNSLQSQLTTFTFEILLAEDDSNDGTRLICKNYSLKYPDKIRLFLHYRENNIKISGKPSANFPGLYNLLSARGKYIAICEGDDLWKDPYKLQKQVDFLVSNPSFSLAYHSYITIDQDSNLIYSVEQGNQPKRDLTKEDLLMVKYHPLLLTLCFKNIFNCIPFEMTGVMNLDTFVLSLLGNHGNGKYLKQINPSAYRQHGKGIWTGQAREKKFVFKIQTFQGMQLFYSRTNQPSLSRYFRRQKKMAGKMLLYQLIKNKSYSKAVTVVYKILRGK